MRTDNDHPGPRTPGDTGTDAPRLNPDDPGPHPPASRGRAGWLGFTAAQLASVPDRLRMPLPECPGERRSERRLLRCWGVANDKLRDKVRQRVELLGRAA